MIYKHLGLLSIEQEAAGTESHWKKIHFIICS